MKKSFLKKAATLLGAVILALPLATSALSANGVKAADEGKIEMQRVHLVKYGFTSQSALDAFNGKTTTGDAETPSNMTTVDGVKFQVYNVSDEYWTDPIEMGKGITKNGIESSTSFTLQNPVKIQNKTEFVTSNGGVIDFELPTKTQTSVGLRSSIYLFHEVDNQDNAFEKSQGDFVLSLPQGEKDTDGSYPRVNVYPKNLATQTLYLKFHKIDAYTKTALSDAQFKIYQGEKDTGLYAQVIGDKGEILKEVKGFNSTARKVNWVSREDASTFVSDEKGEFGFTSFIEITSNGLKSGLKDEMKYYFEETQAPNGYEMRDNAREKSVVDAHVHNDKPDVALPVKNTPTSLLPHTGGAGIIAFVVAGVILIGGAVAVGLKRRRSL